MAKTTTKRTYDEVVSYLRDHGFDVLDAPGVSNRVFLKKYSCSAAIQQNEDEGVKIFAKPGYLIGGEIAGKIGIALFEHQPLCGGLGNMADDHALDARRAVAIVGIGLEDDRLVGLP